MRGAGCLAGSRSPFFDVFALIVSLFDGHFSKHVYNRAEAHILGTDEPAGLTMGAVPYGRGTEESIFKPQFDHVQNFSWVKSGP
jgi:hypothetical protein